MWGSISSVTVANIWNKLCKEVNMSSIRKKRMIEIQGKRLFRTGEKLIKKKNLYFVSIDSISTSASLEFC